MVLDSNALSSPAGIPTCLQTAFLSQCQLISSRGVIGAYVLISYLLLFIYKDGVLAVVDPGFLPDESDVGFVADEITFTTSSL